MELTFDDFRKRAQDPTLSKWEKIGFPNEYREGKEELVFIDIYEKCIHDKSPVHKILDVGCGCSDLVNLLMNYSANNNIELTLIDSDEMLRLLPDNLNGITKIPGIFPDIEFLNNEKEIYDVIIVYSVIQYAFRHQNIFSFIHKCVELLKPGGRLLLGDIPNVSSRNRFLKSEEGIKFSNKSNDINNEKMQFVHFDDERIDDAIIFSIMSRFRNFNCETYLLPQKAGLPFSNRREDILIIKR